MQSHIRAEIDWSPQVKSIYADLVSLRRSLHADPEVGLDCPLTTAKLKRAISDLPLEIHDSNRSSGFLAILRSHGGGKRRVLLRGDMDALPMQEDTGLAFASQNAGAMHACGHDLHATMLAGAARLLSSRAGDLGGDVVFMFQAGEEGCHGARVMIEEGLLDICRPDAAFALHITPNLPNGTIASRSGTMMASTDTVSAVVRGKGGHAAMPHQGLDPVHVACQIVLALQSHIGRHISVTDPAVLSITRLIAGTADNVMPDHATLRGTLRAYSNQARAQMREAFARIVSGIAEVHGLKAEAEIEEGYPPCINDPRAINLLRTIVNAPDFPGDWLDWPEPLMTGEDFAYVLNDVPGAMCILGAALPGTDFLTNPPVHNVKMKVDESAMAVGVELLCRAAEASLREQ